MIVVATIGADARLMAATPNAGASSRGNAAGRWIVAATRNGLFAKLAAVGLFAPLVDWRRIEQGSYAVNSYYYRDRPSRRILERFGPAIEDEQRQRRWQLADAAAGSGDGFGFRQLPGREVDGLSRAAKLLIRNRSKLGHRGGLDALVGIGDDAYVETLNAIAADVIEQSLRLALKDPDPGMRLDGWLASHRRPRGVIYSVPAEWLPKGVRFEVCGVPARIVRTDLDIGGDRFPLEALESVPVDRDTLRMVSVLPRMSEAPPF